jgi:hypothetical protein
MHSAHIKGIFNGWPSDEAVICYLFFHPSDAPVRRRWIAAPA